MPSSILARLAGRTYPLLAKLSGRTSPTLDRLSGRKKSSAEQKHGTRPAYLQDDDVEHSDDSEDKPPGFACTEDGFPLPQPMQLQTATNQAAAQPEAALLDSAAALDGPEPADELQRSIFLMRSPNPKKHAEGVEKLAQLTSDSSDRAWTARVAAFSHISRLFSLLESNVEQVTLMKRPAHPWRASRLQRCCMACMHMSCWGCHPFDNSSGVVV